MLTDACSQNATIDKGGSISCALAFQAKQGAAKTLRYRLPSGKTLAASVPAIDRCNGVAQAGTPVAITQASPSFVGNPSSALAAPPSGTYVLSAASSNKETGTLMAWTIRVNGNAFEQALTDGDMVFKESATLAVDRRLEDGLTFDHLTLSFSCSSPERNVPAVVDWTFGYDASTQALIVQEGRPATLELRFQKVH